MAIEVFNRFENKYLLDAATFEAMEARLGEYMEPDAYNKAHGLYLVRNLYYDTPDHSLIRRSLAKPKYKEKLRLRAYGKPDVQSKGYVEIKKKVQGLVNKRRSALLLEEAYSFLETGTMPALQPYMNAQVVHEVGYMLLRHKLQPAMFVSYERRAYFDISGSDLRISFDRHIQYRETDLRLESDAPCTQLLPDGQWLMEIKCAKAMPVWLAHLLAEFQVYPISFSKYGLAWKQTLYAALPEAASRCLMQPRTAQEALRSSREGYGYIASPHAAG